MRKNTIDKAGSSPPRRTGPARSRNGPKAHCKGRCRDIPKNEASAGQRNSDACSIGPPSASLGDIFVRGLSRSEAWMGLDLFERPAGGRVRLARPFGREGINSVEDVVGNIEGRSNT
jgi:hypothetical protein